MEYLIGVLLAAVVCAFAMLSGFDRDRVFYPTLLIVVAHYYILFAAMAGSTSALTIETLAACCISHPGRGGIQEEPLVGCRCPRRTRSFRFLPSPGNPESRRPRVVAGFLPVLRCSRRRVPGRAPDQASRI